METLEEKYFRMIKQANEDNTLYAGDFVFEHEGDYYLVEWDGKKWRNPYRIIFRK